MSRIAQPYNPPTVDEIASYAFSIVAQEEPHRAREAWRQAEAHLVARRQHDAGLLQGVMTAQGFQQVFGQSLL